MPFHSDPLIEKGWKNSVDTHGSTKLELNLSDELTLELDVSGSKGFSQKVKGALNRINRAEAGAEMLTGLAESGQGLKIFETSELGAYATERKWYNIKWETTTIALNPKGINVRFAYQTIAGKVIGASRTANYTLAHEMYHAWQNTGFFFTGARPMPGNIVPGENPAEVHAVRYTNLIRRQSNFGRIRIQYSVGGPMNVDRY